MPRRIDLEPLKKKISCEVITKKEILDYYSLDASAYQLRPTAIVLPKSEDDIIKIVKFAKKNKISLSCRGAGTGLVGSCLGNGIILDLKNFDKIEIFKNRVVVQPGVIKGVLDRELEKKGKFFPPNPSIGKYCTLGGMIANNSSGSRSLKYGSVIDNLIDVTIIDGNGKIIKFSNNDKLSEIIFNLAKKRDKNRFPTVSKNSCGYRLDKILTKKEAYKIICGSEGTLGIIISAHLKIRPLPKNKTLYIVEYTNSKKSLEDCQNILATKPSALEFVDKNTLRNFRENFDSKTCSLLMIEYENKHPYAKLKKKISGKIYKVVKNKKDIQKWWRLRDLSLSFSFKNIPRERQIPHFIEDAVFPVEKTSKIITLVKEIKKKYSTNAILYGHAGNGNIHVRLASNTDKKNLLKLARFFFNSVIDEGGSISGEHGDGLARSEFVKTQYGEKNYKLFMKLKKTLDPQNILNQDKIITKKSQILKNLEATGTKIDKN